MDDAGATADGGSGLDAASATAGPGPELGPAAAGLAAAGSRPDAGLAADRRADSGLTTGRRADSGLTTGRRADADLAAALDPVAATTGADFSVAVLDTATGVSGVYGQRSYDTASIVKVDILAALLLRAQDEGRRLTDEERARAAAMVQRSDNDAASALWSSIGGADGLDAANARLGLTRTHGGRAGLWGLTQTTAADQLTLLRAVFEPGEDAELGGPACGYVRRLMGRIAPGQGWGVSAAADEGTRPRLKNGWLPRSATGLWDIASIGRITADGRTCLIAVVSDGHQDMTGGVALVEDAARTAVRTIRNTAVAARVGSRPGRQT